MASSLWPPFSRSAKSSIYPSSLRTLAIELFSLDAGITVSVCPTIWALRMRISMSAIGSLMLIDLSLPCSLSSSFYQLALITPGISPFRARSRSLLRPRPNLLYTPRGRPVSAQRVRSRTGEASRGSLCSLARASSRASSEARESWMISISAARFGLNFSTVLRRFLSRSTSASLAMLVPSVLEREAERRQQRPRLVVGFRRGGDGDVHAPQGVDLVVVDLGEDDLLLEAEVVVAPAVEGPVRHARKSR